MSSSGFQGHQALTWYTYIHVGKHSLNLFLIFKMGTGEMMVQWLRALVSLAENTGSVPVPMGCS